MRANKYIRTGLRDRNGIEIKAGNIVQTKRVGIEYQTHTGDNIPNGSYTEPCGVIVYINQYVIEFKLGCFCLVPLDDHNFDSFNALGYLYNPDGTIQEYTEKEIIQSLDMKRNRDPWDNDYSEEKESFEYLLKDMGMTANELIHDCKIQIIAKSLNQLP